MLPGLMSAAVTEPSVCVVNESTVDLTIERGDVIGSVSPHSWALDSGAVVQSPLSRWAKLILALEACSMAFQMSSGKFICGSSSVR